MQESKGQQVARRRVDSYQVFNVYSVTICRFHYSACLPYRLVARRILQFVQFVCWLFGAVGASISVILDRSRPAVATEVGPEFGYFRRCWHRWQQPGLPGKLVPSS